MFKLTSKLSGICNMFTILVLLGNFKTRLIKSFLFASPQPVRLPKTVCYFSVAVVKYRFSWWWLSVFILCHHVSVSMCLVSVLVIIFITIVKFTLVVKRLTNPTTFFMFFQVQSSFISKASWVAIFFHHFVFRFLLNI